MRGSQWESMGDPVLGIHPRFHPLWMTSLLYVQVYECIYVMHTHMHAHTHTPAHIFIYMYTNIHIYKEIGIYMYIYIYMYLSTHTYQYPRAWHKERITVHDINPHTHTHTHVRFKHVDLLSLEKIRAFLDALPCESSNMTHSYETKAHSWVSSFLADCMWETWLIHARHDSFIWGGLYCALILLRQSRSCVQMCTVCVCVCARVLCVCGVYVCMRESESVCMSLHIYICTHTYTELYIDVWLYLNTSPNIPRRHCVYVCIYTYVHTHIHIHTYKHIQGCITIHVYVHKYT